MEQRKKKPYRPCVVGVFINDKKQVLVAMRSDTKAWQFPQGGVEAEEDFKEALFREMKEEIGSDQFEILAETTEFLYYDFPKSLKMPLAENFRGQKQRWFLCRFLQGQGPNLGESTCDEFIATSWITPQSSVEHIVDWKKDVYQKGLSLLGVL